MARNGKNKLTLSPGKNMTKLNSSCDFSFSNFLSLLLPFICLLYSTSRVITMLTTESAK